jgi:UDP-glucose 4-epimerase
MNILVTGGCGYIGSHTLINLIENGHNVYSIDNLVNGNEDALIRVKLITEVEIINYNIDLCDHKALNHFFETIPIDAIIHFAALKSVPESVAQPTRYYNNNITSLINLLNCCNSFKIKYLIFSSSCSTYGNTLSVPVTENTPLLPPNSPYAATKQIGESLCIDASKYLETQISILRYFNPAGAHPSGMLGEYPTDTPTNLVPAICKAAAKMSPPLEVFGNQYPTPDGTCIRDYIHVCDLSEAHLAALTYLEKEPLERLCIFNLGMGQGTSVTEAITCFEKSVHVKVPYVIMPERKGDVIAVFANAEKANQLLNWKCIFSLVDIMTSSWKWQQSFK